MLHGVLFTVEWSPAPTEPWKRLATSSAYNTSVQLMVEAVRQNRGTARIVRTEVIREFSYGDLPGATETG